MAQHTNTGVKTTQASLSIVEELLEDGPATIEELEERFDLATSTVHRHLTTLRENGYVIRDGTTYRLSFKFLTVGGQLRRQIEGYSMIKQKIDDLAHLTDERAQFIVREETDRVYLYTEIGDNPVQTGAHIGRRGPIHASAAGKAILAHTPKSVQRDILESISMNQTGPNTITDTTRLEEELDGIREQGYALNLEESTAGVHAIGAAVVTKRQSDPIGAISVSGPATRLKRERIEDELVDLVLAATNELELHIEHS
ncbi:IclR family transcriptional regulator [Halobellus captivus]|uniref:IclR family transcriptional regulator n=1 Tax=Halobellus captivus TaxID=2592614 RepID=UPI00119E57B3|nr:IclR family transcriptional regulator [Halobellus captivus]